MSRDIAVIDPELIEGELVAEAATLDGRDMCSMNFARLEFDRLCALLIPMISPMVFSEDETACAISRHLEQVRIFSRNFCWQHRHIGAAFGEVGKRPGDKGADQ